MTNTLFIQLPIGAQNAETANVDWALYDAQQQKTAGGYAEPVSTAQKALSGSDVQVIGLVPACDVLQTHIKVPPGQKRHLQRTLPFLVEEDIATPIEDMHLCASPVSHGEAQVLAASHGTMQSWLKILKANQIEPDWLLVDSAAMGLTSDLEILIDSECARFYCQHQPLITAELNNMTLIADRLLASFGDNQHPASGTLILSETLNETEKSSAEALATQFEVEGIELQRQTIQNRFDYQCQQLLRRLQQPASGALINLLSDQYRSTSQRQRKSTPNWKALAATIALCVGLKLVFDLGAGLYLNYQSAQLDDQITTLYQDLFPQDKRIVNVRVQMQNHLNNRSAATSGSDFMLLFGHMADAIKNQNNRSGTQIEQLRYNDKTQTLLVDLQVGDIQQLERLKQVIEARNISADILSANEEQQWIKGRVKLSF